jgi:hypothetical protein
MYCHTAARFLRLAVMSCVLLYCLTAFHTPAHAIAIYNSFVQASLSTPGPIPPGTSFSFLAAGEVTGSQSFSGNALATAIASVSPLNTATAVATGFASGPGSSNAASSGSASSEASLVNLNASTVTFPLSVSFSRNLSSSTILFAGESSVITSGALVSLFFDNNVLSQNSSVCAFGVPNCDSFDSGFQTFLFGVTPGSHSVRLSVEASGSAFASSAVDPVPEPGSLLLLGTTAAGLGLARWRQRRRKQQP